MNSQDSPFPIPLAIAVPQTFPNGDIDLGMIRSYASRAEELGYHSLWVGEQIFGSTPTLEPVTFLSHLSSVTDRIRLGAAVIIATTRNPALLAKELSTLDVLSEGRLIVGTALGGRPWTYPLLGGPPERRARHFVESVGVMRALWTQERAVFDGEMWKLKGVPMSPKPVQKPQPAAVVRIRTSGRSAQDSAARGRFHRGRFDHHKPVPRTRRDHSRGVGATWESRRVVSNRQARIYSHRRRLRARRA